MSILVLDIGTTSMRGILYEKDGSKIAESRRKNHLIFLGDGLIEEDPSDWEGNTCEIIREVLGQSDAASIDAVAITAQRSSVIPVNRDGKPLLPAIMWQDTRNRAICDVLSSYNEQLFEKTGALVSTVFSGSKMTWIRRHEPLIYEQVYKMVNIPEYICYLLTGEFVSDKTYASRTGLMDLRTGEWDEEILKLYEVDPAHLCRIEEPGTIVGRINAEGSLKTGLACGIPVIHGGGDQQCAAVGHGILSEGDVSITVGTGAFLAAACEALPENLSKGMIWNRSALPGGFIMEANVLSCGAAFDWAAHHLYGMERISYALLEKELEKENFVSSPLVIPYFSGKGAPEWDAEASGVFFGITTATRRSELFKSTMESIFMEVSNHLEQFSQTIHIRDIYVGGGMTSSPSLNQLQADVYGRRIYVEKDPEATAFGCFLGALKALGIFTDIKAAYKALASHDAALIFEPDMEKYARYEEKRREMNHLYQVLRKDRKHES